MGSVVTIAYQGSLTTAQVLSRCNPVLGTTGTTGATGLALFDSPTSASQPSGPGRKRKKPTPGDPEEEEDEPLTYQAEEEEGPSVTIKHDRQMKKAAVALIKAYEKFSCGSPSHTLPLLWHTAKSATGM